MEENMTLPVEVTRRENDGRIYIYDTKTGERSEVLKTMLPQMVRKKREDGSDVFTTNYPGFQPKRGTLKCLLHPDDPNRGNYDILGLAVCPKANLTSPFQVRRHMEKRHRMEWQTIEQEKKDTEGISEQEFRRAILAKAIGTDADPEYLAKVERMRVAREAKKNK